MTAKTAKLRMTLLVILEIARRLSYVALYAFHLFLIFETKISLRFLAKTIPDGDSYDLINDNILPRIAELIKKIRFYLKSAISDLHPKSIRADLFDSSEPEDVHEPSPEENIQETAPDKSE